MSVTNPVDSGGAFVSFDRDLQGLTEQMNTVGGWAAMMDQDSVNNTIDEEEVSRDEVDAPVRREVQEKPSQDCGPPYGVQLLLGSESECDEDELYLFLGGDDKIKGFEVKMLNGRKNRVNVDFKTFEFMQELLAQTALKYGSISLRAFKLPQSSVPDSFQGSSRKSSYQEPRESFSRQNSNYSSVSSLAGSQYEQHHGRHYEHNFSRDYQTMPPPGKYRDRDGTRGSSYRKQPIRGDRGDRGGYDRRNNYDRGGYSGDLQRSESYTFDKDRPAPINRSRTEDGISDRRQSDLLSRTSSLYSIDDGEAKSVTKKPSKKDIFGEAKPADTAQKLKEIEERLAEKRKVEAEKAAEKANQQQQQQMQQPMPQSQPPVNYNHSMFHQPPPNYYTHPSYMRPPAPEFVTPVVGFGPGPPQPYMHHQPPQSFRAPGTVRIAQRPDSDQHHGPNISPPQDPEHPRPNIPQTPGVDHPIVTIKEESVPHRRLSIGQDGQQVHPAAEFDPEKSGNQTSKPFVRTINNSAHKIGSFEGRGNRRGGGGSGRGFARGGRGAAPNKVRIPRGENTTDGATDVQEKNNNDNSKEPSQPPDSRLKDSKAKDIHGSHASLGSRGGRGRGGSNRGYYRGGGYTGNRPPRDDRTPRDEHGQKSEVPKEPHKPHQQQRKSFKGEGQKLQNASSPAASKSEVKKDEAKLESTAAPKAEIVPSSVPLEAKEKKKKKKPNASKNQPPLNNNKFAALANDTGDE